MDEIWKDIEGYEGLYLVSNLGNVKSVRKNIILVPFDNHGYLRVNLSVNRKYKKFLVHRLVANAFLPNVHNLLEINHIDENKYNNCVDNLEWCSRKYNCSYGNRISKIASSRCKQVLMLDNNGNIINEFNSVKDAAKYVNRACNTISEALNGYNKTSAGFYWRYKN